MIPLIAAAAASAAASLAGSYMASEASKDAARMGAEQEQKGLDFQKGVYDTQQKNLSPYMQEGTKALTMYSGLASGAKQPEFTYKTPEFNFSTYEDPGAQYQMQQATKALQNSGMAKGLVGGGLMKSIMAKNQEMAGTAYQGAFDRYLNKNKFDYTTSSDAYKRNLEYQTLGLDRQMDLAKLGQASAVGANAAGSEASKNIGASYGNIGQTLATGGLGSASAWTTGLSSAANNIGQMYGYSQGIGVPKTGNQQTNNNTGAST